jgi:hypothetical protein
MVYLHVNQEKLIIEKYFGGKWLTWWKWFYGGEVTLYNEIQLNFTGYLWLVWVLCVGFLKLKLNSYSLCEF